MRLLSKQGITNMKRSWENIYQELKAQHRETGQCTTKSASVDQWMRRQRKNQEKLTRDQKDQLNEINFDWDGPSESRGNEVLWDEHFQHLQQFKEKEGHLQVPVQYPEYAGRLLR